MTSDLIVSLKHRLGITTTITTTTARTSPADTLTTKGTTPPRRRPLRPRPSSCSVAAVAAAAAFPGRLAAVAVATAWRLAKNGRDALRSRPMLWNC